MVPQENLYNDRFVLQVNANGVAFSGGGGGERTIEEHEARIARKAEDKRIHV